MRILLTGNAGLIGHHLALGLLEDGHELTGIDNLNDYYDPQLKMDRLAAQGFSLAGIGASPRIQNTKAPHYVFHRVGIEDTTALERIFSEGAFDAVIHLAAQAGVRYSITHPEVTLKSNVLGFLTLLEACRRHPVKHLLFASSSSVYGRNPVIPYSEDQKTDRPASVYATSKRAGELLAYNYSELYGVPCTALRFFTVYGPWGRPDMAYFSFTRKILAGEPIELFNHGKMRRDFTFVADAVECVRKLVGLPPTGEAPPYRILNIGNRQPVELEELVSLLERHLKRPAIRKLMPMPPGEVVETFADTRRLQALLGPPPQRPFSQGLQEFIDWYLGYYGRKGLAEL